MMINVLVWIAENYIWYSQLDQKQKNHNKSKHNDGKCFQSASTFALNHGKSEKI